LAAQVVERILQDETLVEAFEKRLPKKDDTGCPDGTLCCSKNHVCSGGVGFRCSAPFICANSHKHSVVTEAF
jgi:hypothetical protein